MTKKRIIGLVLFFIPVFILFGIGGYYIGLFEILKDIGEILTILGAAIGIFIFCVLLIAWFNTCVELIFGPQD